jgi:enterochelin esterase-like enzyme
MNALHRLFMKPPFLFLFACVVAGRSEEPLALNKSVEHSLTSTSADVYAVIVKAGDYVAASVDQHGRTDLSVLLPDGSRLRQCVGPAQDGKRLCVFIAQVSGTYHIQVTTPSPQPVNYRLTLNQVLSLDERLQPQPWQDPNPSPSIAALRNLVASGTTDTTSFWQHVAQEHTPLVEPVASDPRYQLVTFLWRGTALTRNVLLAASFQSGGFHPLDFVMHQISGTDVWYVTVRLPAGARFTYSLSINDPLMFTGLQPQRFATMQADPLNPQRWGCSENAPLFDCQSSAELPGAAPQPWLVPNNSVAAGTVHKHTIHSELLKNDHDLSVYLPAGYNPLGAPYDLVIIFDESAYLTKVPTPVILDNLIAAKKMPPAVAVLIANPSPDTRMKELSPNAKFADFLAAELVPWIRAHYHVTHDPADTVVAGSSLGGLAATYAGYQHFEVFGNVLCQSGSFWWAPDHSGAPAEGTITETGWMAKQFIAGPKLPLKFYLDAGTFEYDVLGTGGSILETSRQMRDVLLAKGYEVHYQQFVGGHDYLSWRGTFADGLMNLIGQPKQR